MVQSTALLSGDSGCALGKRSHTIRRILQVKRGDIKPKREGGDCRQSNWFSGTVQPQDYQEIALSTFFSFWIFPQMLADVSDFLHRVKDERLFFHDWR